MEQDKSYAMIGAQDAFRSTLALVGKQVEVGSQRSGKVERGKVANAMFDSLLLQTSAGTKVILYADLVYLTEV